MAWIVESHFRLESFGRRFDRIDERFDRLDQRLDERSDRMDQRTDAVDAKIDQVIFLLLEKRCSAADKLTRAHKLATGR